MFGNFRELDKMRLRIWGSGVRISSGAPLSTHLRTPSLTVLASHDGSFKHVLATFDPNLAVMHLDDIDKRAHIGLPKWHRPGGEMLSHQTTKALDQRGVDLDLRRLNRKSGMSAIRAQLEKPRRSGAFRLLVFLGGLAGGR